ncbi:MAG: hypothetical protein SVR04_11815 [Spirochaetota bacterium]|nr:hypothetical protein [Spirochaetota bacterium]
MKLRSPHLAVITVVLVFGGIFISMLLGIWRTESSKVPAAYAQGEFAGEYNPADIRGSYTFDDIEKAFDIPVEILAEAFGLGAQENPGTIQAKIFEEIFGEVNGKEIGTDSVRLFVALYTGRPYTAEETTALPLQAVDLLVREGRIDAGTAEEIREKHGVETALDMMGPGAVETAGDTAGTAQSDPEAPEEPAAEELAAGDTHDESDEDTAIKGKTTFQELMDWGLDREEIEEVIGMPLGPPNQAVRDFMIEKGVDFGAYKEELQRRLDEK